MKTDYEYYNEGKTQEETNLVPVDYDLHKVELQKKRKLVVQKYITIIRNSLQPVIIQKYQDTRNLINKSENMTDDKKREALRRNANNYYCWETTIDVIGCLIDFLAA